MIEGITKDSLFIMTRVKMSEHYKETGLQFFKYPLSPCFGIKVITALQQLKGKL